MRKSIALIAVLFLVVAGFTSCGKAGGPKAGTAKGEDMLKLLPVDADGVFFIDVSRAMDIEFAQKALTENEDLQEFIDKTNIDPREDIFFLAGAMTQKSKAADIDSPEDVEEGEVEEDIEDIEHEEGEEGVEHEDGDKEKAVVIINLRYDQAQLLPLIKEKVEEEGQELLEVEYGGHTLYGMWQDEQEVYFSFMDASNILMGNAELVKSVIDVIQNKKENIFKNAALADLISKTNRDAMFWGAIQLKQGSLDEMTEENPMLEDLKGLQAASIAFDYKNQNISAEIKLMGADEAKNKNLADFLTGIKGFVGMMATEKPEVGELLSKIEITSGAAFVQVSASIPEELLEKLASELQPKEEEEIK